MMLASASGGVEDASRTELALQAESRAEDASFSFDRRDDVLAGVCDVLAEDADPFVGCICSKST